MKIIKRNGAEVPFDITKIITAVTKASDSVGGKSRLTREQSLLLREMTDMPPAAGRTSQGTGTESLWERLPEIKPGEESGS